MEYFGVELVGFSAESGRKLLLTLAAIAVLWAAGRALGWIAARVLERGRAFFWVRQAVRLAVAI